jgi:type IV pilus assembly protein PilV
MSLVEVMVSAVIFGIGVLGLMNTHAVAFNTFSDAKFRVDAALLADKLIGEMWVDRANIASYAVLPGTPPSYGRLAPWFAEMNRALPAADAGVEIVGTEVRVTVSWQPPGGDRRSHVAVATLQEP